MSEVRSPTVRRRELGAILRRLRIEKNFTVEQAAEQLLFSTSKLSRIETGRGAATARDIRDLCNLYGVLDETEREHMRELAAAGKQQGWWQSYELDYFATYVGLEVEAVGIEYYQSAVVPGLMQTADYARAIHKVNVPQLSPERIEELIEVRMTRQARLEQSPPLRLEAILDEAFLHRVVGNSAIMARQLDRLVELSNHSYVTIQIIPYTAGAHPALESTFNIMEFAGLATSVVYVEGLVGFLYVERPQDVNRYRQVFEYLRFAALNPQDSTELIAKMATHYHGQPS